jgi:FAD:protein FMN transferase
MRPAMGTLLHVSASGTSAEVTEQALDAAIAAVERVDRLMSFHSPDSELSRLNREAARAPQAVDPWTYAVLRRALRISELSDGLFDISIAPMLVREGLLPQTSDSLPDQGTWRDISILPDSRVTFRRAMLIDLGGIAKGFAVDMAIHVLRGAGCTQASVNAGGDLRRFGAQSQTIHLRRAGGLVPAAQLRCGAVATSAPHLADENRLAQPLGHIVDPRAQKFWTGVGAVMVAARSCVMADALTKVAALAGPACEPLLARFGARAIWDEDSAQFESS